MNLLFSFIEFINVNSLNPVEFEDVFMVFDFEYSWIKLLCSLGRK